MNKDKPIELYDYFQREVKHLLNPGGVNKPQAIAAKITSILTNSKRHDWEIHNDLEAVKENLFRKFTVYEDAELSIWYCDLKVIYEEDTQKQIDKVLKFYIERFNMTDEEKTFYKEFQKNQYQQEKYN